MTRHTTGPIGPPASPASATRVLLVGAPNVGKSTLFNALTGARERTTNAPGTTVEVATGTWRNGRAAGRAVVDLPGTYSLLALSADEQVTADAVRDLAQPCDAATGPGVAVVVLDATALARSLYLLAQVAETGVPLVVALTMLDLAAAGPTAAQPDVAALATALGVPVVPVDARDRGGLVALARAVDQVAARPARVCGIPRRADPRDPALVERLAHAETLFAWVERTIGRVTSDPPPRRTFSDRVDTVLLNPWAGIPVFLAVVWLMLEVTTKLAAPLQVAISHLVSGPGATAVTWLLGLVGLGVGWVHSLLVDGLLAGVGTVATFLPVMAVMFAALGILEDSGYLSRAAFVADRAMRSVGLDGRALLPLVVGFGCNLPALAATRALPHARQRLLTGLLIPLTSCSARLTVYVLLAGAFFPDHAGTVIFAMYLASVLLVLGGGLALRHTVLRDVRPGPLILVLPPYQRPHLRALGRSVRVRVWAFTLSAGKVIVATLLVVWVLMAVPVTGQHDVGDVPVADSVYGHTASGIAPLLAPAGFGNDHAAAALLAGFVAKEVVVGSFAQSYAVTGPARVSLAARLRQSFATSSGGHGDAAALAFLVFVLAYTPCVAVLAEQRRLFGWRTTASALATQLTVAWVLAVGVFQVGSRL